MKNLDAFRTILKKDQKSLKSFVTAYLEKKNYKPVVGDGFVYAVGDIPIMLVAHMDTVHKIQPLNIYYDSEQDVMWSPDGIGGDDRCGVYTILKIIENYKPYILFTEDEEIGCKGAKKAVDTLLTPNVKFIIEIDRRGSDDCVFYDCGNKKFMDYIETFGFKTAVGSYSDICVLSDEWEIASVNLSSGYHYEHTTDEIIKLKELENTYKRIKDILVDEKNSPYFDYDRVEYQYTPPTKTSNTLPKKTPKTLPADKTTDTLYDDYGFDKDYYGYYDEDGVFHYYDYDDVVK